MRIIVKNLTLIGIVIGVMMIGSVDASQISQRQTSMMSQSPTSCNTTNNFRPEDALYHNYPELVADVQAVVQSYPSLVQRFSIGSSYEGCDLIAVKISKNVATDETMLQTCYISATF